MVDARLHDKLKSLLEAQGWDALSPAQQIAWAPIHEGHDTLLMAPTGSGKTESALLPVLDRLLIEKDRLAAKGMPWPVGFKALYITPLRALNRDLLNRLEDWSEALGLTIGVRHGDTSQAERAKQARRPPDLLITTPETTQLLLYGDTLRRHLGTVRFVVLDEVHDLAANERGAQLAVALARIDQVRAPHVTAKERAPAPLGPRRFQRIGLSATIHEPGPVADYLGPKTTIVEAPHDKKIDIRVVAPVVEEADHQLGAELAIPGAAVAQIRCVRDLVAQHERVLIFVNTRDGAEVLAHRSGLLDDGEPILGLHHGSLAMEHRVETERRFKAGELKALVATSSMELGIDVGAIDHVIQIQSPRSVSRLVQRLGRAGHHLDGISRGTMLSIGPEDHLECQAIADLAVAGDLEPRVAREAPLTVVANQIVALANEYAALDAPWAYQLLLQAPPFADLDEGAFLQVWEALLEAKTVFQDEGHVNRSGRSRKHFLNNLSLIPDQRLFRIFDEAAKRTIGTVDDGFIAAGLHPGASFIMAGRAWRVLEIDNEAQRVRVAPAKDLGGAPQWSGTQLPVSHKVAGAAAALRGCIAEGLPLPGADAPILAQQEAGLVVPTDKVVVLEQGRAGVVAFTPLGTQGNDALGTMTAALLQQRGRCTGFDHDAYRIHFRGAKAKDVLDTWQGLETDSLDVLLSVLLREQPMLRHHLVHVAKVFGALPKDMDPTRITKATLGRLWEQFALQEETLSRLIHDRFDLHAVASFLDALGDVVIQATGPLAAAGDESSRLLVPRNDKTLLAQVRRRIETSDVVLVCTQCGHQVPMAVSDVEAKPRCRRCSAAQMACLRHWDLERWPGLRKGAAKLAPADRRRVMANASLMAGFAPAAARLLVGRGIGAETAARILQRVQDIEAPDFWRELLHAELEYARTSAMWR